jgi:membrane associated rhomboid family serine protease
MLFLWIFGDNLENLLGHIRYAVFYILCGLAAAIAQIVMDTDSIIPMLGASGAISGVLGGYVLLFPQRQVRAIIFNFLTTVPAFVAIGIWIVYQLVLGYMTDPGTGGVAYMAHIGGFFAGLVLVKVFALGRRV